MDDIKDVKKADEISRFVDSQNVRTDPFGQNRVAGRLYQRAERIGAALYLLTRHVPSDEPIRREIRSESLSLFSRILDLKDELRAAESEMLMQLQSSIRRLISLIRVMCAGGFVSFQNADAVIHALDELGALIISSRRTPLSERYAFTSETLMGDTGPLRPEKDIKDRHYVSDIRQIKDMSNTSSTPRSTASQRSAGILSILQGSGELGIKDIATRLPDYSEKIIQRELANLIKAGKVKKTGFKRWSKYAVA